MNSETSLPPARRVRRFLVVSGAAAAALFLAGCAGIGRVQPWEHATLSDYTMRPDRDPLGQQLAEHVYFSREAASGGRGVGGAGCGCN